MQSKHQEKTVQLEESPASGAATPEWQPEVLGEQGGQTIEEVSSASSTAEEIFASGTDSTDEEEEEEDEQEIQEEVESLPQAQKAGDTVVPSSLAKFATAPAASAPQQPQVDEEAEKKRIAEERYQKALKSFGTDESLARIQASLGVVRTPHLPPPDITMPHAQYGRAGFQTQPPYSPWSAGAVQDEPGLYQPATVNTVQYLPSAPMPTSSLPLATPLPAPPTTAAPAQETAVQQAAAPSSSLRPDEAAEAQAAAEPTGPLETLDEMLENEKNVAQLGNWMKQL